MPWQLVDSRLLLCGMIYAWFSVTFPVCCLSHPSCRCLNLLSTLVKRRRVSRPYKNGHDASFTFISLKVYWCKTEEDFHDGNNLILTRKKNSMVWVRERTIPTERPRLVGEVIVNFFADRGCLLVSVTDPYDRILGFLDRSRYFFYQVAPQLYSRGWVAPLKKQRVFP
jgi:hypothetical protein